MRRVRARALAPRIIVVIALALALTLLGRYLVNLGHRSNYGWFAYEPLHAGAPPNPTGLRPWARLLIWLGLIAVWAAASAWLLWPAKHSPEADQLPR